MNQAEIDAKIENLSKKQKKEITALIDNAGKKTFDEAVVAGSSPEEADKQAVAAALKAGEDYINALEQKPPVESKKENKAEEKQAPVEKKFNFGGYTSLQTEPGFKGIKEKILAAFPEDTEIKVINFAGAPPQEKEKGMHYRITVIGNKSGTKRICV